jgi:hypothetical protein
MRSFNCLRPRCTNQIQLCLTTLFTMRPPEPTCGTSGMSAGAGVFARLSEAKALRQIVPQEPGLKAPSYLSSCSNRHLLRSRAPVDRTHALAWSGEVRVCHLATFHPCVHLEGEICTTWVSLSGRKLGSLPFTKQFFWPYRPQTAGGVLVVALSAF